MFTDSILRDYECFSASIIIGKQIKGFKNHIFVQNHPSFIAEIKFLSDFFNSNPYPNKNFKLGDIFRLKYNLFT